MAVAPDFVVAVPSFERQKEIGEKTLAVLTRQGITSDKVYVFVADEEERQRYVTQLGSTWPNVIVGKPSLWRQRNFITNYFAENFAEGKHVISMDDDVEELFRLHGDPLNGGELQPLHEGGLIDIINDAWNKMHRFGIYLWSLNVSDNPYFMNNPKHGCGLTLKNGLCNGFFWGCRIRTNLELCQVHGDGHEDIERTVRYLSADGAVFRYREFCAKTKCKTNAGGLQSTLKGKKRKDEEARSIKLLADEFPLFLEIKEGSKLGAKFTSVLMKFRRHSSLTISQFRNMSACKHLNTLVGARCAFLIPSRGVRGGVAFRLCTIELVRQDVAILGMKCQDGQLLFASSWAFNDALQREQLFIVWLPADARKQLGLGEGGPVENLPAFLDQDRAAEPLTEPEPQAEGAAPASEVAMIEPRNEFGKYLATLQPSHDDGGESDDEEEEDGSKAAPKPKAVELKVKGLQKVEKKGSARHEDAAWIESQQEELLAAVAKEDNERKELDILNEWSISTDFNEALKQKKQELAEAQKRAKKSGSLNTLFCGARIWGGGWGGQCTRTRLPGEQYCSAHSEEIGRQRYLTHGRIDGDVPPKKLIEMQKWQTKLRNEQQGKSSSSTATSQEGTAELSEAVWRSMGRGAGESCRAFAFRTGNFEELETKKRKGKAAAGEEAAPEAIGEAAAASSSSVSKKTKRAAPDVVEEKGNILEALGGQKRPASSALAEDAVDEPKKRKDFRASLGMPKRQNAASSREAFEVCAGTSVEETKAPDLKKVKKTPAKKEPKK